MNNKIIIGIIIVIAIAAISTIGYILLNRNEKTNETEKTPIDNPTVDNNTSDNNDKVDNEVNDGTIANGKTLVVYYSATGSTKKVAEQISKNLNADLFEIVPENIYTSDDLDWTNENSRVSREHNDETLRNIKLKTTKVDNWENYDTILIGYPIWWGMAAWPINNFVKSNNFTNKKVIPFCTSASSDLGQSGKLLEDIAIGGNWLEGKRFSSGASISDVKTWTDSLK